MVRRTALTAVTAVAAMSALSLPAGSGGPAFASASRSTGVHRSGACTQTSTWRLSVKRDRPRLEVQAEIHSLPAWTWHWRISDDGVKVASGSGTTGASSDSFSVTRRIPDRAGTDHVVFRATYLSEVCRGAVAF